MDFPTAVLDFFFLFLALAFFPGAHMFTNSNSNSPPSGTEVPPQVPSAPHTPIPSPAVPAITITPDRPSSENRPAHSRKSVSFSLTSLDDLDAHAHRPRRPPTPFVSSSRRGDVTPSPAPSVPATPMVHSHQAVDPMGAQKDWLMA